MAIATALLAGYSAYNAQNSNELSDIALANVEALAAGDESNSYDCNLSTFDCKIEISKADFDALVSKNSSLSGKYNGDKIDLTDLTLRCTKGNGKDQCMKNILCNDVARQIGILKF